MGLQVDGPTVYASTDVNAAISPEVSGIAYGSNIAATPTTTLFAIDTKADTLVTIGTADGSTSPDSGNMFTVGSLGIKVKGSAQLDITTSGTDVAFAILTKSEGGPVLYRIDLTTGAASTLGKIAKGVKPVGMTALFDVI